MNRLIHMLASLILAMVALFVAAPADAAPAQLNCPVQTGDSTSQVREIPVVYVHGWTGTGADAEASTLPLLQFSLGSRYRAFAFDYGWANTTWGAEEKISGCLAKFVEHLADASNGQVAIVAHSMGGLASRAATTYLAKDGRSDALAGIVTLGTPHQGTPFSGLLATLNENMSRATLNWKGGPIPQWNKVAVPPDDSPASKCLAFPHPSPCAPVPYVQPGQKIASVAGQVNVIVTFFGLTLRDAAVIDAGDSIVPTASALGYPGSFTGSTPPGSYLGEKKVVCQRTTSQLNAMSLQLGFFDLANVNSYLDEVNAGRAGIGMSSWAYALNFTGSPCNHGALPTSTEALADAVGFINDMHIGAQAKPSPSAGSIPGLPAELSGKWCTASGVNPSECFDEAEVKAKYPQIRVASIDPAEHAPGAKDIALCIQMDLGDHCTTASSMFLRYFPTGVGWNCVQAEVSGGYHFPACKPDFSSAHDLSRPRLVHLLNHQQGTDYYDTPPMYRAQQ